MIIYIILITVFLAILGKDIVKKDIRCVEIYTPEFQDPYLEYDALDDAFEKALKDLEENNSVVEVLNKPCDTKVDRSS